MGVNFPDLQVLLPRVTELGRLPAADQQAHAHQQSLAIAAQAESEREQRRVTRSRETDRGAASRQESSSRRARSGERPTVHDKLGRRLDVRG